MTIEPSGTSLRSYGPSARTAVAARERRERRLEERAQLVERAGRRGRGPGRRSGLAPHDGNGRDRDGRRLPRAVAGRVEPRERLVEARDLLRPRAVREERHHVRLVGEHVVHEALERPLRADLDEGPRARGVEPQDAFDPAHGGGDLAAQQVLDGPGLRGVEVRGDVADQRQPGRPHVEPVEDLAERPRGRCDDLRVERVAHREPLRLVALLVEGVHGELHRRRLSPDHDLAPRVEVRRHHVAGDRFQLLDHEVGRGHHRRHRPVVAEADLAHLAAARRGRFHRLAEGEHPRRHQGAVLAERVAHHHVRLEAELAQQPAHRGVHRQHGGLGDRGLLEVLLRLLDRLRVLPVHEDVARQLAAEDGREDAIGFLEDAGHERVRRREVAAHVDVLAALAGEEEGDLAGGGAAAPEDALGLEGPPGRRRVGGEGLLGLLQALDELLAVLVVDRDALARREVGRVRHGDGRHVAVLDARQHPVDRLAQAVHGLRPEHQQAAQGRAGRRVGGRAARREGRRHRDLGRPLPLRQGARDVLLEHHVEVRPAEAVSGDAAPPRGAVRRLPLAQVVVRRERRRGEVDAGVGRASRSGWAAASSRARPRRPSAGPRPRRRP